jgi:hypothetical protein
MKKGSYKMAEQIDGYGFFGSITLECEVTGNTDVIELTLSSDFEIWRPGIMFGAAYFIEHFPSAIGLSVNIIDIDYNEVETNNTIIAFITLNALLEATQLSATKQVLFEKSKKSFIFPIKRW